MLFCKIYTVFYPTKAEALFKDKLVQLRLVCFGSLEKIDQVFVSGEDQAFLECEYSDIVKGLVDFIFSYYVFDVTCPEGMVGILFFLEDIG